MYGPPRMQEAGKGEPELRLGRLRTRTVGNGFGHDTYPHGCPPSHFLFRRLQRPQLLRSLVVFLVALSSSGALLIAFIVEPVGVSERARFAGNRRRWIFGMLTRSKGQQQSRTCPLKIKQLRSHS